MPKISTDEWLKEIDSVIGASVKSRVSISDRGFTLYDIMERSGIGRNKAIYIIREAIEKGTVKHIGYRPGQCGTKVFEVIK